MDFHCFILKLVHSSTFRNFIMTVILINTVTTAFYASMDKESVKYTKYRTHLEVLTAIDNCFLGIYTVEFILKVSIHPRAFFYNGFNCFDFVVLLLSYLHLVLTTAIGANVGVFKVLRSVRALRPLRSVSFVGGLQVIVSALIVTLKTTFLHICAVLSIIMFIFAVMGYYILGYDRISVCKDFETFTDSLLSLFVLVTAEGWTDVEHELTRATLEDQGRVLADLNIWTWGRIYIIVFLFIGHFVCSNLFVAVIIGQIDTATTEFNIKRATKQETDLNKKKVRAHKRQEHEIKKILEKQKTKYCANKYRTILISRYSTLRSDEFMMMKGRTVTSQIWAQCFNQSFDKLSSSFATQIGFHRQTVETMAKFVALTTKAEEYDDLNMVSSSEVQFTRNRRKGVQHAHKSPDTFQQGKYMFQRFCDSCSEVMTKCVCALPDEIEDSNRPKSRLIEVRPVPVDAPNVSPWLKRSRADSWIGEIESLKTKTVQLKSFL